MKRRWLFVPFLIGILAIGVVAAGATLAQESDTEGKSRFGNFASRVAEILGIEEAQVQDAFQQARSEMVDEAIEQKMTNMVEKGVLTQEQTDEIVAWRQARPEDVPGFDPMGKRGHGFHGRGPGMATEQKLESAVERGSLTQKQADALQEWYNVRPDVLDELVQGRPHRGHRFRGGFEGGRGFGGTGIGERVPEAAVEGTSL